MAEVTRVVDVPAQSLWAVIADGWTYAGWVVGASHIRRVDQTWPTVGSHIHHSVGSWPLTIDDTTEVLRMEPQRLIELNARAWPTGEARVRIELDPVTADSTRVRIVEQASSGPGALLPKPLQDAMLVPRNRETLSRLTDLALRRSGG
ncbi:SRPBCC family protein [Actinokineospora pegani]|uniref:SRPBCC family protein n=1 Tax=Actinokineospora pegani TaxID=2654637 RepID=UPI0012EB042B|nr:SRPBCC family protein [Actinokineospora pegani]